MVWMNNVVDALVRGSRPTPADVFLRLSGDETSDIKLLGNDFGNIRRPVFFSSVPDSVLTEIGNIPNQGEKVTDARSKGTAPIPPAVWNIAGPRGAGIFPHAAGCHDII